MDVPLHFLINLDIILPKGGAQEHPIPLSATANSFSLARTSAWYTICGYMPWCTCLNSEVKDGLLQLLIRHQHLHPRRGGGGGRDGGGDRGYLFLYFVMCVVARSLDPPEATDTS